MSKDIRVRFAPSPTGQLHTGNARTALFNFLFARHHGGTFVLRIEDTDVERSSAASEKSILSDLKWLGIDWDEGVEKGGEFGPYRQTERLEIYRELAEKLLADGKAYKCFCTQEELKQEREEAVKAKKPPQYSGRCRSLTDKEKKDREGTPFTVRFEVTSGEAVMVPDLVRQNVYFERSVIGDFIIIRSDGIAAYNFAVVVDDALMKISHVIRGEDHLSNTPKQILLYNTLGWTPPIFAHIPMILGPDRAKLSKRNGIESVAGYREKGFAQIGVMNYLSLLGWNPGDEREIMRECDIVEAFSLDRVSKSAAIFDPKKMRWMNASHVRSMDSEYLLKQSARYIEENERTKTILSESKEKQMAIIDSVKDAVALFSDVPELISIYSGSWSAKVDDAADETSRKVLEAFIETVSEIENLNTDACSGIFKVIKEKTGVKGKKLFQPVRLALTGTPHGPELSKVVPILGKESCIGRAKQAIGMMAMPTEQ